MGDSKESLSIMITGAAKCGKTSLNHVLLGNSFSDLSKEYHATIGLEVKNLKITDNFQMTVYDLSDNAMYNKIRVNNYQKNTPKAILLAFDISASNWQQTLNEQIQKLEKDLEASYGTDITKWPPVILTATKADNVPQATNIKADLDTFYAEITKSKPYIKNTVITSAVTQNGIPEIFQAITILEPKLGAALDKQANEAALAMQLLANRDRLIDMLDDYIKAADKPKNSRRVLSLFKPYSKANKDANI